MTVGVICAIPQELAYLRGVLVDAKRQQVAQILFIAANSTRTGSCWPPPAWAKLTRA